MNKIDLPYTEETLVLDDSRYFLAIEQSLSQEDDEAPAFMYRRSHQGLSCIGRCEQQISGEWEARLNVIYDEESNSDALLIGSFDSRVDAIVHLWQQRANAVVTA